MRLIAASIALVVAISLPLGYWLLVYRSAAQAAAIDADVHADLVSQRINANPDLWRFEAPRLEALASVRLGSDDLPEKHSILDERGTALAETATTPARPLLTRSAPLLDSGREVGRFVTSRSLLPLLKTTVLVALFGLLLAFAAYSSLSVLPLRALTRTFGILEQERTRLRAIFDNAVEGIITLDLDGILQSLNPAAERMFGYGAAEVVGRDAHELLPGISAVAACRPGAPPQLGTVETIGLRRDGSNFPVALAISQATLEGRAQLIVIAQDVTERKRVEQALRDKAQELRLFTDNAPAMTVSYDQNLRCRFANRRFAEFFGFTVDGIVGKHLREVVGADVYSEIEPHFAQVLQGRPVTYQRTRQVAHEEPRYLEARLLPHIGEDGQTLGCFAVTTDITELKLVEKRIERMAHHDSLTGLPNRLLFNDRLTQAISLAKRDSREFALLFLDLDRFKLVNDALGHAAGDELLRDVAARIRRQVRESDTVARVGGDEFTVILPEINRRSEAATVAKKIIAALAVPFHLGAEARSIEIGVCIGIAIYPADGADADALVHAADDAMYRAKPAGNSFVFFAAE